MCVYKTLYGNDTPPEFTRHLPSIMCDGRGMQGAYEAAMKTVETAVDSATPRPVG